MTEDHLQHGYHPVIILALLAVPSGQVDRDCYHRPPLGLKINPCLPPLCILSARVK
jgi:hypothetical protein